MARYYRIHPGHRPIESMLDAKTWRSEWWSGEATKRCTDCYRGETAAGERCETCRGRGEVPDVRRGVSACASLDDLRAYMERRHANVAGDWLVAFEGDAADDDDHDAADGGVLTYPRAIVSARRIQSIDEIEEE